MKISAAVVCLNEEKNIGRCLASLDFCDEIIVVDNGSSDDTVKIAKKYANKVYFHKFAGFSDLKTFAVSKCKNDWVFVLDADEEVSDNLKLRIKNLDFKDNAAFEIKRSTFFLGREIKHCGWGNDYQLRLFDRRRGAFDGKKVHESILVNGKTSRIKEEIFHYSYPDRNSYFTKLNRYTTLQAQEKQKSMLGFRIMTAPFFKFIRMYIFKLGFLDGWQGYTLCKYSAFSEKIKFLKMREIKDSVKKDSIVIRLPNWLGDAVMATALLGPVKKVFKKLVVLADKKVREVVLGNPHVDVLVSFDKNDPSSVNAAIDTLKKMKPNAAATFSPSLSSGRIFWQAGIPHRAGFKEDGLFLTRRYRRDPKHSRWHIMHEFSKVISFLDFGFDASGSKQYLNIDAKEQKTVLAKFGLKGKYAVLAPFVKYGPAKMWPKEKWQELINRLRIKVVIAGTEGDLKHGLELPKTAIDLRGKTTVTEMKYIINNAAVFIGNDSGLMHVADALETPLIAIFGSTNPHWTGPVSKKAAIFSSSLDCAPCYDEKCRFGHYNCLKEITVDRILKTAQEL